MQPKRYRSRRTIIINVVHSNYLIIHQITTLVRVKQNLTEMGFGVVIISRKYTKINGLGNGMVIKLDTGS